MMRSICGTECHCKDQISIQSSMPRLSPSAIRGTLRRVTEDSLQLRKQQMVRSAIYDAAIELFAEKGFDETTVEEVAKAAGVSRRSFFRYFASKDDLLAQNVVNYGHVLAATVTACAPALSPLETVRETVQTVLKQAVVQPHTRQIIEIAQRSDSARQAHGSRMHDVEEPLKRGSQAPDARHAYLVVHESCRRRVVPRRLSGSCHGRPPGLCQSQAHRL
jgi:DNA-binding transcriptional regulator YbjK